MLALATALFANATQTSATPGRTASTAPSATALPIPSCDLLDQATSANEDFTEATVAGDIKAAETARLVIHDTFGRIKISLSPSAVTKAEAYIRIVDSAFAAGNLPRAGEAAIEVYGVLINGLSTRLATTLDVATLDYTGYKIQAQAAAKQRSWTAIDKTVELSATNTASAVNRLPVVDNKALISLVTDAHAGIEAASDAKLPAWITTATQIQLDSVDFLEGVIKNPSPDAC